MEKEKRSGKFSSVFESVMLSGAARSIQKTQDTLLRSELNRSNLQPPLPSTSSGNG